MKIDKSIWDTFSQPGSKNNQVQSSDTGIKSANTLEPSASNGLSSSNSASVPSADASASGSTAETDAAVKLSGADEVEVKSFMQSVNGTPEEKMAVVQMAQNKGIPLTRGNLTALQRVMTDSNPAATIKEGLELASSGGDEAALKQLVSQLQKILQGTSGVRLEGVQGGFLVLNIEQSSENSQSFLLDRFTVKDLMALLAAVVKGSLSSDAAKNLLDGKTTLAELDLQISSETTRATTANTTKNSAAIGQQFIDAVEQLKLTKWSVNENQTLETMWESATKDKGVNDDETSGVGLDDPASTNQEDFMNDMLQGLEQSISAMVENLQNNNMNFNEATASSVRQVLRVEVTQRMVEAKAAFKTMKSDITDLLQKTEKPLQPEDQKRLLKSVVEKLDNFIMKSDAMMYTSMKNERDLVKTSSVLQDALKLLDKNKADEALTLTKKAIVDLDRMVFKPSSKRVEAHLNGKLANWQSAAFAKEGEDDAAQEVTSKITLRKMMGAAQPLNASAESSGRLVMEMMRKLGLNNEFENSEHMLKSLSKKDHDSQARLDDNVKAALMKMAEDHGENKAIEPVQRALETILGTQLMNRHEVGKDEQTMMFVVPWGSQAEQSVKVMVNGRKNGGVMSWENCSLYFSFNTKRLGQTGIRVTIADKTVSMAVFNDHEDSKAIMSGYVEGLYKGFVEVGFQKGNVGYAKFGFDEHQSGEKMESRHMSESMKIMAASSMSDAGRTLTPKVAQEDVRPRGFELKI